MNRKDKYVSCLTRKLIPIETIPQEQSKMKSKTTQHIPTNRYTTGLGSSETVRETTFDFLEYTKNKISCLHASSTNRSKTKTAATTTPGCLRLVNVFLEWFVGFSEGDASFITSNNRLFFVINQKEVDILSYICKNLGFGKVSIYNGYGRYVVADRKNIDWLILLFNGNLVLKKTNLRFKAWLELRNQYSVEKIACKASIDVKRIDFNSSCWLSGFIDAEGCFSVASRIDKRALVGFTISFRFIIDQKDEKELLEKIQSFFVYGYLETRRKVLPLGSMHRVVLTSRPSILKCVEYLKRYPLKSNKRASYFRFLHLFNILCKSKPSKLSPNSLKRLQELIKNKALYI